ncbi:MAG: hypothetical protein CVV02_04210 [Firmicutes bacterium HGW-Firmicutes-7]|nr:MAG: hypothetical protein CVV02_04210 [Firmicutes bacterium HGW-Firmicutes-7]
MIRKKKSTVKKVLLVILIIIVVGVYLLIQFQKSNKTPNSFNNAGYLGNSLYYDTLKELGYKVSYEIEPIENINTKGLVVLNVASNSNGLEDEDYEKIFQYVRDGGIMLVLFIDSIDRQIDDSLVEIEEEHKLQPYRKWVSDTGGVLMYGSIDTTSNITVSTNREMAYSTLRMLHPYIDKEGMIFNEYYLYVSDGHRSLWKEIPQGLKFIIYQILLVIVLFFAYKGKRFGAPSILYEEVEPDEHQYAKAVGGLYYRGGHYEVLIDAYYKHFINKVYHKHLLYYDVNENNWLTVFQDYKDIEYKTAKKVHDFMSKYKNGDYKEMSKKRMKSKIKELLIHIQTLEKTLDQK